MKVQYKCFSALADKYDCDHRTPTLAHVYPGDSVSRLLEQSGIPQDEVKLVFVNGRLASPAQMLRHGDSIALAPATGGM